MCGGTARSRAAAVCPRGLSPRVRGNHAGQRMMPAPDGSIPACAGEPYRNGFDVAVHPVYPRVCGGTRHAPLKDLADVGLSPRVRGNLLRRRKRYALRGSIPACAGEPAGLAGAGVEHEVYPRVCGGTLPSAASAAWTTGLSPRVRGNHRSAGNGVPLHRSIPACAGEPGCWAGPPA